MMHCLAIRHVAFEDLGAWQPVLEARGWRITYHDAGVAPLSDHDPLAADLVVVGGGPLGVNDADYPVVREAIDFIARRVEKDLPTVGLCLGSQMLAAAAGARVYRHTVTEIGFLPVTLTEAGRGSCLAPFEAEPMTLHWHGDTFDLPAGATRLASSALTENQAFSLSPRLLGLQFHPEWGRDPLEPWLIGHLGNLRHHKRDVAKFRAEAEALRPELAAKGAQVMARYLADAGLE